MEIQRKKKYLGCSIAVILVLLLALIGAWLWWFYQPMSEEELKESDISVITETRYVISADSVDILAFTSLRGDTLLNDIVAPGKHLPSKEYDKANAQWIRMHNLLPYCGGTMAVEAFDTAQACKMSHAEITALLQREASHIAYLLTLAEKQKNDIDYFTRTHTVTDNGFDIVAHYGEVLAFATDSVNEAADLVNKALSGKKLRIRLDRKYYIDSFKGKIECKPVRSNNDTQILELSPTEAQEDVTVETLTASIFRHSRMSEKNALVRLKDRLPKSKKVILSPLDSTGTYSGARDSVAMPHGYGRYVSKQGEFYEGEWVHGKREGVGFAMYPGKNLKLGEWKNDKFLGERITYTPERVYGIDISRFQHEDGRKRYNIDWKNLRITSLGKISKKKIEGAVNYPIRFVYIKATEGTTIKSKYFASDYVAAKKHGYRAGAYHFFSIMTPGKDQAAFFLKHGRYAKGDLHPVLDVEPTDAQIKKAGGIDIVFKNVRQWLTAVERRWGVKPILYISQSFVNKYLSKAPDLKKNYDVWIARYGEYKPDVRLVYWQLCPDGRVSGIHGTVDINVYNGFNF